MHGAGQYSGTGSKIAAAVVGLFFAVLAMLALVDGFGAIAAAETIMHQVYGVGMLILSGTLFIATLLCSLGSALTSAVSILESIEHRAEELAIRTQGDSEVANERWETLCASLDKLEAGAKAAQSPNAGEDFDPTPDYSSPIILKAKCPKCGKTVKAKSDWWAGRAGKCPSCGSPIQFPAAASTLGGVV